MTTIFVDTSALGRRYLREIGSSWTLTWILRAAGNVIGIAEITPIEMFSTFARLLRENVYMASDITSMQNNLLLDVENEYLPIPLEPSILLQARTLVTRHPLRTLDAIQLASALNLAAFSGDPVTFISGDSRLLAAAAVEGFSTDHPYLHQ